MCILCLSHTHTHTPWWEWERWNYFFPYSFASLLWILQFYTSEKKKNIYEQTIMHFQNSMGAYVSYPYTYINVHSQIVPWPYCSIYINTSAIAAAYERCLKILSSFCVLKKYIISFYNFRSHFSCVLRCSFFSIVLFPLRNK